MAIPRRRGNEMVRRAIISVPNALHQRLLKYKLQTGNSVAQILFGRLEGWLNSLDELLPGESFVESTTMTTVNRKGVGLVHRINIEIPATLFRRLEKHVAQSGESINRTLYSQIEDWLRSLPDPPVGEIERYQKPRHPPGKSTCTSRRTS